jgi:hypothetical protein
VPAGLAAGGAVWAWRIWAINAGLAGRSAFAPAAFDARQWRRQVAAARGALAAPGLVPLATAAGAVPVGPVIRCIGRRWTRVLAVPAASFARHLVIAGASGSGKTNLMMRLWGGWYAVTLAAARRGKPRPLLAALDCKSGPDARAKADRTRRLLHGVGAARVGIWPDEASLSLWDLPARDLAVLLHQLTEHGTGGAAYYADITQAVLTLAVCAPGRPPASAAEFLDRLDAAWLEGAYADGRPGQLAWITAARPHPGDIQLRYATLLGRLGPALDGPGRLADADAWYFIPEGTREPSVAEGQAMAITEMIAHAATDRSAEPRAMLLAADDYSAVSRRVPLSNLYERGRSLGLGVMVSAQSWQGLGRDEDERYRIAATADGGLWLLQTPHPEPLVALAGTRRVLESAHKLIGATWGDEGTTRIQHAFTADPGLIRRLGVGQASPQPTHPPIIDKATWQAAQSAGAEHGTSRDTDDTTPVPATGRIYPYRSRIRCRDCKRRMAGNAKGPRRQFIYYRCPHDPASPRDHATAPGHPVSVQAPQTRLDQITGRFFRDHVFTPGRAQRLAAQLPVTDAAAAAARTTQTAALKARIKKLDTAQARPDQSPRADP